MIGITFISRFKDVAYIIYLAINEKERNKGYGTSVLKLIDKKLKSKIKVVKNKNR